MKETPQEKVARLNPLAVAQSIKVMEEHIQSQNKMIDAMKEMVMSQNRRIDQLVKQMQETALIGRGSGPTAL